VPCNPANIDDTTHVNNPITIAPEVLGEMPNSARVCAWVPAGVAEGAAAARMRLAVERRSRGRATYVRACRVGAGERVRHDS
jgi:hypothetical protein